MVHHLDALITARPDDPHARAVQREIRDRGGECLILDTLCFPLDISLSWSGNGESRAMHISSASRNMKWMIDSDTGIWWRRPRGHSLGREFPHPHVNAFAAMECSMAFLGSLAYCCPRFVNPITSLYQTTKLYELRVAADVGLAVPETLVTTDPADAMRFVRRPGQHIYKTFRANTPIGSPETRLFAESDDIDELWRIRYCPAILQTHIPAVADLRVTIVDQDIFCGATTLLEPGLVDGRFESTPPVAYTLPSSVIEKLFRLTRTLGLIYAAIDLRLQESGDVVFLEVNPAGQYLWQEVKAGLPISAAIARLLVPKATAKRDVGTSATAVE